MRSNMKPKTLAVLFVLVIALSMAAGVFAQDFTETWDENTVLTVFNDLDMYFPDMFADEDSDFIWTDNGPADFPSKFPGDDGIIAKAPIDMDPAATTMEASYDPCGDGLIKYDVTITKSLPGADPKYDTQGIYYGDKNTSYIRDINAYLTINGSDTYKLDIKKCKSTGGDECHSVSFKKNGGQYQAHLKGFLTVPDGIVLNPAYKYDLQMFIDFSTYMTALWPVEKIGYDSGTVKASAEVKANTKKDYCQSSLEPFDGLAGGASVRGKYDENTGEARLQAVIRNYQPDVTKRNYVIPGEVFAHTNDAVDTSATHGSYTVPHYWDFGESQRVTEYKCEYTVYNTKNAAPRTDYCKFGEGIAIPDHGMLRIDITIDHLSGAVVRKADGNDISFSMRFGGMLGDKKHSIMGFFAPVEFPCPPVTRMLVMDPLRPFMSFYKMDADDPISPSGAYNTYEGGLWGMYQKCGKYAYMAVRLKNDGVKEEVIDLNHAAVSINGGSPITWAWVMTTISADWNNRITLDGGEDVILIGRAKVTDYPYQLNADNAMNGAVNFTDYGIYITGKVYSDHNNTRCY